MGRVATYLSFLHSGISGTRLSTVSYSLGRPGCEAKITIYGEPELNHRIHYVELGPITNIPSYMIVQSWKHHQSANPLHIK